MHYALFHRRTVLVTVSMICFAGCSGGIDESGEQVDDIEAAAKVKDGGAPHAASSSTACGDGKCNRGELCSTCSADCGGCATCGDGTCNAGEDCGSCAADCGGCATCGDGTCNTGEDCGSCSADCGACATCGDGTCNTGEDCGSCAADCGACPGTGCTVDSDCVPASCCHAAACVPLASAPICNGVACTTGCEPWSMDCGQGACGCQNGFCAAIFYE